MPMVALPSDVARSGKNVKRAYETVFKAMVSILERSVAKKNPARRTTARAIAALCVGGMVAARSLADGALADELRDACMAMASSSAAGTRQIVALKKVRSKTRLATLDEARP